MQHKAQSTACSPSGESVSDLYALAEKLHEIAAHDYQFEVSIIQLQSIISTKSADYEFDMPIDGTEL